MFMLKYVESVPAEDHSALRAKMANCVPPVGGGGGANRGACTVLCVELQVMFVACAKIDMVQGR